MEELLVMSAKDAFQAEVFRRKGNKSYKDKDLKEALKLYNKSVLLAPWTSGPSQSGTDSGEQRALAFGNRSAVLYELGQYQVALRDIHLSLDADPPHHTKSHLLLRKLRCLIRERAEKSDIMAYVAELQEYAEKELLSKDKKQFTKDLNEVISNYLGGTPFIANSMERALGRGAPLVPQISCPTGTSLVLPHTAEAVGVCYSPHCGRYLVANSLIKRSEVIIQESPYAALLYPRFQGEYCDFCFQKVFAPLPCHHCAAVAYCSEVCCDQAQTRYHWLECGEIQQLVKVNWVVWLALRTLLASCPIELRDFLCVKRDCKDLQEGKVSFKDDYTSVYSLVTHEQDVSDTDFSPLVKDVDSVLQWCGRNLLERWGSGAAVDPSLPACPRHKGERQKDAVIVSPVPSLDAVRELLLHHTLQLRCNAHAVTAMVGTDRDSESPVQGMEQTKLGSALYVSASLLNHSCDPNTIVRFNGNQLSVVVTRDIAPQHEVSLCYGPHFARMARSDRQKLLREQYFFDCCCPACLKGSNAEVLRCALLCQSCSGPLVSVGSEEGQEGQEGQEEEEEELNMIAPLRCLHCTVELKSEALADVKKVCENASDLFSRATAYLSSGTRMKECTELLHKCLALREKVLYRYNTDLAETHDCLAQSYSRMGEFALATVHCRRSAEAVEVVYGEDSIELAQELHKLSQLLFNSKAVPEAITIAERAKRLWAQLHLQQEVEELDAMLQVLKLNC